MAKRHPSPDRAATSTVAVPARPGAGRTVAVRVRPGAGRTRVGGRYDGPHGPALIVAVGAPAVDGKATEAVRRELADVLGVRIGDVTLKVGATSRDKVFTVDAAPDDIERRVAELRDGTPGPAGRGTRAAGAGRVARAAEAGRRLAELRDGSP